MRRISLLMMMLGLVLVACAPAPQTTVTPDDVPATEAIAAPTETDSVNDDSARAGDEPVVGLSIGNLAPDFETVTEDGEPIKLSDLRGEVVLLNFWATWCGPCRIEMPEFQEQFAAHDENGFHILAVNNSETVEQIVPFRDDFGLTFPIAMDERGDIQREYGIFSYPTSFIVDADGVIVSRHFGALTTEQIDEIVSEALNT